MKLTDIMETGVKKGASDIYVRAGTPPIFRIGSTLTQIEDFSQNLSPSDLEEMAYSVMTPYQKECFHRDRDIDLGYGLKGIGRFRINIFYQRGTMAMVIRAIPYQIPRLEELNLPKIVESLSLLNKGLILVTGSTGSGKSTTLAAMIDYINNHRQCHILTIEDPIEFLHRDKKSAIDQREVGLDAYSFGRALRAALRQDSDVILVGEMRDRETIETALWAAETGHLVLSTLHTLDATETISRIIAEFPSEQQKHIRLQLSSLLKAVISQRLVPRKDDKGKVVAVEILVSSERIKECIEKEEKTKDIPRAMAEGVTGYGMQTFDQSLLNLYNKGLIDYEEALRQSTNPSDFALRVKGIKATSDLTWDDIERDFPQTLTQKDMEKKDTDKNSWLE